MVETAQGIKGLETLITGQRTARSNRTRMKLAS